MGIAGSPLRDRVIFVLGAFRSGTTWLTTLLATHPEIAGIEAESHLFDSGVDRLFDNFDGRNPYYHLQNYLDREQLVDLVRDLCDGILMAMRAHVSPGAEPPFVVEKTPIAMGGEGLDLARKRECYPDAWYVHIVRDREAVADSLMRSPFMADRSYRHCAALWDESVGAARRTLGDHPRYREVSYEDIRSNPAEGCRAIFAWLGVDAGEEVLEKVGRLSRDQYSDMGAVPGPAQSLPSRAAGVAARLAAAARERVAPRPAAAEGDDLAFTFVRAMREHDADALRAFTAESFDLEYRGADGDLTLKGDAARAALVEIASELFSGRYVNEWWGTAGGGPGEWWTRIADWPFWTIFFSALRGDATRVDLAIGLILEEGKVRRARLISAGPLSGRSVEQLLEPDDGRLGERADATDRE
jgi:hypothetical protein